MSPIATPQTVELDVVRLHPVPFDEDGPPNLGLPDGTPEDTETRVRQLDWEIAWREQRIEEHVAAVRVQKAIRHALKHDPAYRPYSKA